MARRKAYVDLVALSQFLPGPAAQSASPSACRARAMPGALAAWLGFTAPSAIALILFGYGVAALGDCARTRPGCMD